MANHNAARDAEIIRRYSEGETAAELCAHFKLTRGRMYQILKGTKKVQQKVTTPPRDLFLGINVSEQVKDALLLEAARRGVSISSLSSDALRAMLVECGYPLEAERIA